MDKFAGIGADYAGTGLSTEKNSRLAVMVSSGKATPDVFHKAANEPEDEEDNVYGLKTGANQTAMQASMYARDFKTGSGRNSNNIQPKDSENFSSISNVKKGTAEGPARPNFMS